ncbi:MAG TPA: NUDIX domain-containing protein [Acidobacteriaceae bacterium]|jgi:ADP-ribose pyrophosphatase YjhB (NUDIX family)|nr:NUDIX domain-containing protein [Acidobacteriaceae bacterium]
MRREYPDAPIAGVGAVIVRNGGRGEKQVLLVRRAHEPLKGEWSLPGGAVEVGETLQEAICREVLEETGLVVETVDVVEAFDRISRDPDGRVRFHYVLVDFLCRVAAAADAIACASDALEGRWAGPGDLEGLTPKTVEVIRKAWRMAS